eukprot:scaffold313_cov86-Isochrysis_galbana.AAC.3
MTYCLRPGPSGRRANLSSCGPPACSAKGPAGEIASSDGQEEKAWVRPVGGWGGVGCQGSAREGGWGSAARGGVRVDGVGCQSGWRVVGRVAFLIRDHKTGRVYEHKQGWDG